MEQSLSTSFIKKIDDLNLAFTGQNQAQNEFFCYFLEFGSEVFLQMEYDDSLGQCLTSSRGKTHEKGLGTKYEPKWPKLGLKLGLSPFS